jgi:hypothetical protein
MAHYLQREVFPLFQVHDALLSVLETAQERLPWPLDR